MATGWGENIHRGPGLENKANLSISTLYHQNDNKWLLNWTHSKIYFTNQDKQSCLGVQC